MARRGPPVDGAPGPVPRIRLPFRPVLPAGRTDPDPTFAQCARYAEHRSAEPFDPGDTGQIETVDGYAPGRTAKPARLRTPPRHQPTTPKRRPLSTSATT
ncbi:hypothetical protein [Plantactinospora soyae]|uniref:Uncharacterized protein n=1 Tax=Plantactinospora soyae TaxID=1544732 RepID=A0A927MB22_9ACTN|nr:hypothetical protein [Plantactinospora soyae]MBE1491287.1 hypothetical protein [Plantactinospora soyae]